jgi:hypothetical protein
LSSSVPGSPAASRGPDDARLRAVGNALIKKGDANSLEAAALLATSAGGCYGGSGQFSVWRRIHSPNTSS